MAAQYHIETLNDLFAALFRGSEPVLHTPPRPVREELFALFFPDALVQEYEGRSKSNLTWFFNSDPRNKSVRRSLLALLGELPRQTIDETHRKCSAALFPPGEEPAFDAAGLRSVLGGVRLPAAANARWHILEPDGRLDAFYRADPSAALARMLLTLSLAGEAPDGVMGELWRGGSDSDYAFMLEDSGVEARIRYYSMLDLEGRHVAAFDGYQGVARQLLRRPAKTPGQSAMYCRMGDMLIRGEGCLRNETEALGCYRLACGQENPGAYCRLGERAVGGEALEALEKAAELGHSRAIRLLGDAWYQGSSRLGCARNLEAAKRSYQKGLAFSDADGAYCAYMLGQIYEAQSDREAAVSAYRVARENGSPEAAERLARLDWTLGAQEKREDPLLAILEGDALKYCLTGDLTGCALTFFEGLRRRWDITVCSRLPVPGADTDERVHVRQVGPEKALRDLCRGVYWGGAPSFPPLFIALLSDDCDRNLAQAVAVLGELQKLAGSLGTRAWDLVDCVRLYVRCEREYGELMLDAAMAGMGELCFRVRLCDPDWDAADQLLSTAPLFLPRLRDGEGDVRLNVIGCGGTAMAALRRAVALPLPGAPEIHVYGMGAEALRLRFLEACPGMLTAPEGVRPAMPAFHEADPEAGLVSAMRGDPEGPLASGDYYIVAAGDDQANLRLAVALRRELMRQGAERDRQPFIAARVRAPMAAWLAGSLTAGAGLPAAKWFSQYELYPFGGDDMYAPDRLQGDLIERRAQQAHMLFLGLPNTRDARHAAMVSYYRRQEARQTARLTALSLVYRMHLAGVSLPGWKLYGTADEEARLGAAYSRWLGDGDHLREAVRAEHERRCRALISLGWESCSPEQVEAYARRGNPSAQLAPARLDPLICPWEDLDSGDLLSRVRRALKEWFPEKNVQDPRRAEEESVRDTERLLNQQG